MTIKLFGWDGQTNNFEIGELSEIDCAGMCVCDGRGKRNLWQRDTFIQPH